MCTAESNFLGFIGYIELNLVRAKKEELKWTDHVMQMLSKDKVETGDYLSWAAFHMSVQPNPVDPITLISLLLLLSEKAVTIAMIKHGMNILNKLLAILTQVRLQLQYGF